VPEGVAYAPAHAERLFPGFKVVYEENDASKGMWFLIVADGESNTTKIYAVKQDLLKWEIPQDEPVSRYITCPASVAIKYQNGRPEIDLRDNR
jgi:hypothetical protein